MDGKDLGYDVAEVGDFCHSGWQKRLLATASDLNSTSVEGFVGVLSWTNKIWQ